MILSRVEDAQFAEAFGIDMASVAAGAADESGVGVSWVRIPPGGRSDPHQHDETEMFVVVRGTATMVIDGVRHTVRPGTVAVMEPFETHVVENDGDEDVVLADMYWRDAVRATRRAGRRAERRRFDARPVFVFSTPPTPNGDLHLGHLSGPYLGADAFVRFQRMNGQRAWHLTGSDDFQSYVAALAEQIGEPPEDVAARYSREIRETLRLMDIELDQYTVTQTAPGYADGVRRFFSRLVASERVQARETGALVDVDGRYLYEVDVRGDCPGCGGVTSGNICEECGEPNTCIDLGAPLAGRDARPATEVAVERFILPLHEFAAEVSEHHRLGRAPARLRELARKLFAREALDIPVTHPSSWGIRPADDDLRGTNVRDQVFWVWPEMSFGFLYGIEALGRRLKEAWKADEPDPEWKIVHFFGYDNSFYHSVLYPVLYRLAHPEWSPSIDYHPNEFYLLEGSKFSTSRRHLIWGKDVLSPQTVDAVRYFLCRTRPEIERTNYSADAYGATVRDVLCGRWQRWLRELGSQVDDLHGGLIPDSGVWAPEHVAFLDRLGVRLQAATSALSPDGFSLNCAAAEADGIVEDVIRFAREQGHTAGAPLWADHTRTSLALQSAAAALLAAVTAPLMPRFANALATALGCEDCTRYWPDVVELVPAGTRVALASATFFTDPQDGHDTPVGGTPMAAGRAS